MREDFVAAIERAIINLHFALAEIHDPERSEQSEAAAIEHVRMAMDDLAALAACAPAATPGKKNIASDE